VRLILCDKVFDIRTPQGEIVIEIGAQRRFLLGKRQIAPTWAYIDKGEIIPRGSIDTGGFSHGKQ
jgi:hypothetical protein